MIYQPYPFRFYSPEEIAVASIERSFVKQLRQAEKRYWERRRKIEKDMERAVQDYFRNRVAP